VLDRQAKTGSVEVTIDTTSVNTGYPLFNEHIQGNGVRFLIIGTPSKQVVV